MEKVAHFHLGVVELTARKFGLNTVRQKHALSETRANRLGQPCRAKNTNVPLKGLIQKRKTYHLQIITFRLQRAAGPYSRATSQVIRWA